MHDWFVTVLISVREMAAESGLVALAEEIDVAILVAANENHEHELAGLNATDDTTAGPDTGRTVSNTGDGIARNYH